MHAMSHSRPWELEINAHPPYSALHSLFDYMHIEYCTILAVSTVRFLQFYYISYRPYIHYTSIWIVSTVLYDFYNFTKYRTDHTYVTLAYKQQVLYCTIFTILLNI